MNARRRAAEDPLVLKIAAIAIASAFLLLVVGLPVVAVFAKAFEKGAHAYFAALARDDVQDAIRLTAIVAAIVVPLDVVFGVAAAWLITRHRFPGKSLLVALIDLPFAVSPVISGLVFVLLFGRRGVFGAWLIAHDVKIVFALPGIVLATAFVTFPFVARELIPAMQAQGVAEEEAAMTLGAKGASTFFRVSLPKMRWALLYGVVLCNARAMGEFGAVSVVSGHVRGETTTIPLQVEMLYDEYDFVGAFAAASVLTFLAVVTLVLKKLLEARAARKGAA